MFYLALPSLPVRIPFHFRHLKAGSGDLAGKDLAGKEYVRSDKVQVAISSSFF